LHRKKFGFFQSEKETFSLIAKNTGMVKESSNPDVYLRHPFVWLVEAADDICYNVIDLEDSQRLGIIDHNTCTDIMLRLLDDLLPEKKQRNRDILSTMPDKNERISFLRATCISALITRSHRVFEQYADDIIAGTMSKPILDIIAEDCSAIKEIYKFSIDNIYNYRGVVEIENAGYTIMYELLSHFIPPTIIDKENREKSDQKALKLIPPQYLYEGQPVYNRVLGVLDYVSGMTDNYATDMYRKLKSIDIGINF
jgi:dGTPase